MDRRAGEPALAARILEMECILGIKKATLLRRPVNSAFLEESNTGKGVSPAPPAAVVH